MIHQRISCKNILQLDQTRLSSGKRLIDNENYCVTSDSKIQVFNHNWLFTVFWYVLWRIITIDFKTHWKHKLNEVTLMYM